MALKSGVHYFRVKPAYHHLVYDQGGSGLIQDIEFSGSAVGVSFEF